MLFNVDGVSEDELISHAERASESFGGSVIDVELASGGGMEGLFNGDVFTVKRRSWIPIAEYISRHTTAPRPTAAHH